MTITSPTPSHNHSSCCSIMSSAGLSQLKKQSSLLLSPPGSLRRRSSTSSIYKVKTPTEKALQGTDKRRRYMRRGSKTSGMLRGSFRVQLPDLDSSNHSTRTTASTTSSCTATTAFSSSSRSLGSLNLSSEFTTPSASIASTLSTPLSPLKDLDMSPCSRTTSPTSTAAMHRALRNNDSISPPFLQGIDDRRKRKESTVSLLASALALSSIDDSDNRPSTQSL